jgi:lipopolysaccharide export system protein LptA
LLLSIFCSSIFCLAQDNNIIKIIENNRIYVNSKDSFKIVVGQPAIVRQGTTLFKADSIYINDRFPRKLEAYGNVYINENDSVITRAQFLEYFIDTKTANLKTNVSIKSNGGTYSGSAVQYDLNSKLATYNTPSTIVSKNSTLTSKTGKYYSNTKDALFTDNVVLKGPDYDVITDSLYYNVNTEKATFVTYTKVTNKKKGQVIETFGGFYDMKKGIANFNQRSVIKDKNSTAIADEMYIDDKEKIAKLKGKASIVRKDKDGNLETYRGEIIDIDDKNQTYFIEGNGLYSNEKENFVITGNYLDGDGKTGRFLARGKPVLIVKQENDSIFIAADTLYSGKMVNNHKASKDTLKKATLVNTINENKIDTFRYFEAFHHVRIFSDSTQAICDSLYYSDVDSVFRLYQNPIVWNDKNQVTGDTIYVYTKNKKLYKASVIEQGFVLNTVMPNKYYNQIRGNNINAFFVEGNIDSLHVKGSSEIVFFIQDDDKAYVGVDKSSADIIIANFLNKELYKLKWVNKYDGTTTPMKSINDANTKLRGFNPQPDKRPKSKFELFF